MILYSEGCGSWSVQPIVNGQQGFGHAGRSDVHDSLTQAGGCEIRMHRMPRIVAITPHVLRRDLRVVRLSSLGREFREAMDGLEVEPTDVGRAFIRHAPPLTFQRPLHGLFGQFAAFDQGTPALGGLVPALRTAQPVKKLVLAGMSGGQCCRRPSGLPGDSRYANMTM